METSASTTFLKAFLLTNVVVLSRHAVAEGENSFSFVHSPTLCIHTSWFKRQQFNFRHEPIFLNEMFHKCFISSQLCFCGAQFLLLLLFFSALEEPDKTIGRGGPNDGISYVNFVEDKFFFLNITTLVQIPLMTCPSAPLPV